MVAVLGGWLLLSGEGEYLFLFIFFATLCALACWTGLHMTAGLVRESASVTRGISPATIGMNLLLCGVTALAAALLVAINLGLVLWAGLARGVGLLVVCFLLGIAWLSGWICLRAARRIRDLLSGQ